MGISEETARILLIASSILIFGGVAIVVAALYDMRRRDVSAPKPARPPAWVKFDAQLSNHQDLPEARKPVLVRIPTKTYGRVPCFVVGYLKYAAGDKTCPYFVTPGAHGLSREPEETEVVYWCDCLPEGLELL